MLIAILTLAWMSVLASPAEAHALLERSVPAAGSSLPRPPGAMLLYFTEAPEPSLSTVSLLDSAGQAVPGIGKPTVAPANPQELRVVLPRLTDGVYTVSWRTVSKVDGHTTGGSFAFGIGVKPGQAAAATQGVNNGSSSGGGNPTPAAVAGLWLLYWGLALLVGAGTTGMLVFGWQLPPGARIGIGAGWLLAAAGILTMILAERATAGAPFGELFRAAAGRSLLAQATAVIVCGMAALFAGARPAGPRLAVLGVAAAAALFTRAQAGHAETQSAVRVLNVTDQWAHMLAAAVWVGGLAWLLLGLRSLDGAARASAVRRFSQLAFISVAVLAVTGVLRAVQEAGSLGALVSTSFGVVLLIKTGLFAALMVVAWRNRYRLVPRVTGPAEPAPAGPSVVKGSAPRGASPPVGVSGDPPGDADTTLRPRRDGTQPPGGNGQVPVRSLQRAVRSEMALAALVLAAAAVLSGLPPASFVQAVARRAPAPRSVTVTGSDFGTTVRVRLTVSPGTVGSNRFEVKVLGYDSGQPLSVRGVRLEFSLPSNPAVASSLSLTRGTRATWAGQGTNLSITGRWDIDAVVQEAATAVDVGLRLRTRLPPEQVTVSRAAGQPALYTIRLRNGYSLQGYLDPATLGAGVAHFTFFRPSGSEAPISSARAEAITPGGADQPLKLIRFSKGHFGANLHLTPGQWTFLIAAAGPGGHSLSGYYAQVIRR